MMNRADNPNAGWHGQRCVFAALSVSSHVGRINLETGAGGMHSASGGMGLPRRHALRVTPRNDHACWGVARHESRVPRGLPVSSWACDAASLRLDERFHEIGASPDDAWLGSKARRHGQAGACPWRPARVGFPRAAGASQFLVIASAALGRRVAISFIGMKAARSGATFGAGRRLRAGHMNRVEYRNRCLMDQRRQGDSW